MEMKKLSEVIEDYEKKAKNKEYFFGYYFQEPNVDGKLKKLKLMLEALGDVEMSYEHIRMFLYLGSMNKSQEEKTVEMGYIKGYYSMFKDYPDMPLEQVNYFWNSYDKYVFRDYDMLTPMKKIIEEYGYSTTATRAFSEYTWQKKKEMGQRYQEERKKLEPLKGEYGDKFIFDLQQIITSQYYTAEYVLSLLPSKEFIDKSSVRTDHGYYILSGEDIVTRILRGYVDLEHFDEDEHVRLGPCTAGRDVFTSFTKKEYLEEISKPKKTITR